VAIVVENVGYGATYAAPIARDVLRTALETAGN
jgi:cell division protein FtsI/penicillin-binding protein 2